MRVPNRAHRVIATAAAFVIGFLLMLVSAVPPPDDAAAQDLWETTTTTSTSTSTTTTSTSSTTTTTEPNDDCDGLSTDEFDATTATTTTSTSTTTTTTPEDDCDDSDLTVPGAPDSPDDPTATTTTTTTAPSDSDDDTTSDDDGSDESNGSDDGDSNGSGGETGSGDSDDGDQPDEVASGKDPESGGSDNHTGTRTSDPVAAVRGPVIGGVQHVLVGPEASTIDYGGYAARPGLRSTADIIDQLGTLGSSLPQYTLGQLIAPFPVAGAAHYGDDWGAPRVGHTHEGTDIFAARGTPIVASLDGVVENMRVETGLGGTSLRVRAADGTYHYYAHLNRHAPGLADGDRVSIGDIIGYMGNTGNARTTPPHLHIEVHPNGGGPVPPVPYLDMWLEQVRQRVGSGMVGELQRTTVHVGPSYEHYATSDEDAATAPAFARGDANGEVLNARAASVSREVTTNGAPVVFGSMLAAAVWVWTTRPRNSITSPSLTRRFRRA